jgi:hypothetical protein
MPLRHPKYNNYPVRTQKNTNPFNRTSGKQGWCNGLSEHVWHTTIAGKWHVGSPGEDPGAASEGIVFLQFMEFILR